MALEVINEHPRDKNIQFTENTHTYTINGKSGYKSVTTWIHEFFPAFNSDFIIKRMRAGKNWGPQNKYYKLTNQQIKDMWKQNGRDAANLGTEMHLNIENYYNNIPYNPGFTDTPEYKLFMDYLKDHEDLRPFRTEWRIYSSVYRLAGSVDMIYQDPNNKDSVIIADWKRSKEIRMSNGWEKGYGPLSQSDNCNYWHYVLQLNVYRMIIEKYYNKEVAEMFLIILHTNKQQYLS